MEALRRRKGGWTRREVDLPALVVLSLASDSNTCLRGYGPAVLLDLRINSVVRRQIGGVPNNAAGCTVLQLCEGLMWLKWWYSSPWGAYSAIGRILARKKALKTACTMWPSACAFCRVLASRDVGYGGLCSSYIWGRFSRRSKDWVSEVYFCLCHYIFHRGG